MFDGWVVITISRKTQMFKLEAKDFKAVFIHMLKV